MVRQRDSSPDAFDSAPVDVALPDLSECGRPFQPNAAGYLRDPGSREVGRVGNFGRRTAYRRAAKTWWYSTQCNFAVPLADNFVQCDQRIINTNAETVLTAPPTARLATSHEVIWLIEGPTVNAWRTTCSGLQSIGGTTIPTAMGPAAAAGDSLYLVKDGQLLFICASANSGESPTLIHAFGTFEIASSAVSATRIVAEGSNSDGRAVCAWRLGSTAVETCESDGQGTRRYLDRPQRGSGAHRRRRRAAMAKAVASGRTG